MPKQNVAVELFYGGAWHDIVTDDRVFADAPIVIKRGQTAEGSEFRPCQITCSLDNRSDKFRTSNPLSPLYGKAGLNAPMRVSVGGAVRGIAEASSWAADQTDDFRADPPRGKAWVDVEASGVLGRIGQWTELVVSPLRYATESLAGIVGYWPLEDPAGVLYASSPTLGARNVKMVGHSFGSQNRPPGGGTAVDVGEKPFAGFLFDITGADPESTDGWQVNQVIYLDGLPTGGLEVPVISISLLNGDSAFVDIDGDTNHLVLIYPGGNFEVDTLDYRWQGRWIMMHMEASYSGGTTTIGVYWRAVDDSDWEFFTASYTGVPSVPYFNGTAPPSGCSYGHYVAVRGFASDLRSDDRFTAFLGHPGELAAVRFGRLCDQSGIPYYVSAGWARSMPMGPQGPATLPALLKEIVDTEDGLLFDYKDELRIFLLCRYDRYNQEPGITLTPQDLPSLPKEVGDNLGVANIVTAVQRDGGDSTARDDTGPLGTQPPPDGVGEEKKRIDVNLDDPAIMLPQLANWWLRRSTVALPRYPTVTVDLNAVPALAAAVTAVDVGSVIEITGFRENTVRLHVLGWSETVGTHTRMISFTCAPDLQFVAGVYDTSRYDLATCTLDGDHAAGATSLTLQISGDEAWSTTAEPYDLMISGERVTVTAMGARTGVAGAYTQTATVTRAVNGIAKILPDGSSVRLASQGRWAL